MQYKKPIFSRKHYEAVASALWSCVNDPEVRDLKQLDRVVREFVFIFEEDNPKFNAKKFIEAATSLQ